MTNQKISRTKVDLFTECPRCFWLDRVKGISRPDGYPFTLNNAVDRLLKSEFDHYRALGKPHPAMEAAGLDLIPFRHDELEKWRTNFTGVQVPYKGKLFHGAVDDVWTDKSGQLYVVDYKATAKANDPVKVLTDSPHHRKYRRQVEFYQWLLRRAGFSVSPTGYLAYATANSALPLFNGQLLFQLELIPFEGDCSWVETTLEDLLLCLEQKTMPAEATDCSHCHFVAQRNRENCPTT